MTKQISIHASCAKVIRQELKIQYPQTKFEVRSETFSGGNSVDVSWTDGPTTEQVNKIIKKYQYGHFDGMIDCYEISNRNDDIPQVKFVQTQRTMSDETKQKIIDHHNSTFCEDGQIKDFNAYNKDAQCWNHDLVYRIFNKMVV